VQLILAALLQVATLTARAEAQPRDAGSAAGGQAPLVEIRVLGDDTALTRVRVTATELFARLDVRLSVVADGLDTAAPSDDSPLVLAYVDLRVPTAPMVDVDDGRTRQELMRRRLADVSSLETGVEAAVHVVYASVEARLQLTADRRAAKLAPAPPAPAPPAPAPPAPAPPASAPAAPPRAPIPAHAGRTERGAGLDLGAAFRLVSLGDARLSPGAGASFDARVDAGPLQAELDVLGVLHSGSELDFNEGSAMLRPYALRVVPGVSVRLTQQLLASLGVGLGLDHFVLDARSAPSGGTATDTAVTDPVLTSQLGLRFPIGGAWFLSVLGTLDLDLEPTRFVIDRRETIEPLLALPRLRGGMLLIASLSPTRVRRFAVPTEQP
jgi:hypothetical protein